MILPFLLFCALYQQPTDDGYGHLTWPTNDCAGTVLGNLFGLTTTTTTSTTSTRTTTVLGPPVP